MFILSFSYRSKKNVAYLRLRFRHGSTSIEVPTKIETSKSFWDEYKKGINFRDVHKSNLKKDIDEHTKDLKTYVHNEIEKTDPGHIDKQWLKKIVNDYYNPPQPEAIDVIPHNLIGYWNYYLKQRGRELQEKKHSYQKWITVRNKVQIFQDQTGSQFEIKDVNEDFLKGFINWCKKQGYSNYTIEKEFAYVKMVCNHARSKNIEVSPELDNLKAKLKKHSTAKIYLTFGDLEKIKALKELPEYLENAKDWLIISCYTGQRVSDFMRFTKQMIRKDKGKHFLDVKQVKTGKAVTIPLLPDVIEILEKRNGEFPRSISAQKYNSYIKKVCLEAKLKEKFRGKIRECIAEDKTKATKNDFRGIEGEYEKHLLVSSHIGRRSFATNFYGKIPTTYLKNITGHGTEQMLLAYIGKSSKDTAFEAYDLLLNAKD